jgi:hypothetical protein
MGGDVPLRRRAERALHMLRHVPPRQILRRLELMARRRLALPPDRRPPPPLAAEPPLAPLPPPAARLRPRPGGFRLALPWGERDLALPLDWRPAGPRPLDRSWQAQLHYMEYLAEADAPTLTALVDGWIADNPPGAAEAWRCSWRPYNLSIRTVAWMQALARLQGRLDPAFLGRALASLAAQLRWLEQHLEIDLRGNHLIKNLRALLWAGKFFAGPEAGRWRRLGRRLLAGELKEQILADGAHYERSPSYHCQVMADLLECRVGLGDDPLRPALDRALEAMAAVARCYTHPDGGVALLNDGGLNLAQPPAALLGTYAALLGRPPPAPPDGPFALAEAGYFGLRRGGDYLLVDCGPLGPDYLVGHGHADILSFEWSTGGLRIVVDPGTYQYAAGSERAGARSTLSHNTLSVDGAEQSDLYGAFRCGRRARAEVLGYTATEDGLTLEGTHDGFAHLPGRPRHLRRLAARPGEVVIHDRVLGDGRHRGLAGLLLHPACEVALDGRVARVTRGDVAVTIASEAPLALREALWSPDMYVALPTRRVAFEVPGGPAGVTTRLSRLG